MAGKDGRRGHNEGAIYQRADGRWVGAVHLGWEAGKRKRKVVYGKTRAEVNQKVTRILAELQKGLPIATASPTLATYLDEWLTRIIQPSRTPGTFTQYQSVVNTHLKPTLGKHRLEKLTQHHVQAMMSQKLAEGVSPAMVRQIHSTLRSALTSAMRADLVHRNVASLAMLPTVKPYEGYVLSPDEVKAIMVAVKGDDLEALYAIATSVGLRRSELLGLRWSDVDLERSSIVVRKQLQLVDGKPVLVDLKSTYSRRTVPLVGPVQAIVKTHRARQIAQRLRDGMPWSEDGFLFTGSNGSPVSGTALRLHWYTVREAAGLPDTVRFHDLRHAALTILANRGTLPQTLKGIAGHSNIAITMGIYTHLDIDSVRTSVDLMADLYEAQKESS